MKYIKTYEKFDFIQGDHFYIIISEDGKYFLPNYHGLGFNETFVGDGLVFKAWGLENVEILNINNLLTKQNDGLRDRDRYAYVFKKRNEAEEWVKIVNWYLDQELTKNQRVDLNNLTKYTSGGVEAGDPAHVHPSQFRASHLVGKKDTHLIKRKGDGLSLVESGELYTTNLKIETIFMGVQSVEKEDYHNL